MPGSFESQVDKILEKLINEKLPIKATEIGWEKIGEDVADAKQALLNAHREDVKRIIGEDESNLRMNLADHVSARNQLRAEQRQRLTTAERGEKK